MQNTQLPLSYVGTRNEEGQYPGLKHIDCSSGDLLAFICHVHTCIKFVNDVDFIRGCMCRVYIY
jgi:hypothetical protein